jgi:ABC-type transport system substrate-binding protein
MRSIRGKTEAPGVTRRLVAAALLGLPAIVACSGPLASPIAGAHPGDDSPRRGGTLHLASFADMRGGFDPATNSDGLTAGAIEMMFAGLVDYDQTAHVVPDLASRYEVDPDGRTYRFFLREGVRFHDGDEVTAEDVKRSIERALHPSTPNPWASSHDMIVGYADYVAKRAPHLAGVVVEGRYVVSIRIAQPDARFLPILALQSLRPVCKSAGDRYSDTWAACGAGPFRLQPGGWDQGRSLTIVRHEGYFRPGLPYLDAVTWSFGMNIVTGRFKLESGDLDATRNLSQADVVRFQTDPRWKPLGVAEPETAVQGEGMNTELPPFDNVEVRRAVAAAIDREHYHDIRPSAVRPAFQPIPPSVPGYDPTFQGQKYDYAAALEHMKRAGYPYDPVTGQGGYGPTITYYVYRQSLQEFTGQVLQQDLAKIGLRIQIKVVSYPTFQALTYRRRTVTMSGQAWQEDYPDPSDFFEPLFASSSINDELTYNAAFYANPRLDEILVRARRELDPTVRYGLYGEANRIVCDDAPWAFTMNYRFYNVHQAYVRDYPSHPLWAEYLTTTWLDRDTGRTAGGGASWRSLTAMFGQARGAGSR